MKKSTQQLRKFKLGGFKKKSSKPKFSSNIILENKASRIDLIMNTYLSNNKYQRRQSKPNFNQRLVQKMLSLQLQQPSKEKFRIKDIQSIKEQKKIDRKQQSATKVNLRKSALFQSINSRLQNPTLPKSQVGLRQKKEVKFSDLNSNVQHLQKTNQQQQYQEHEQEVQTKTLKQKELDKDWQGKTLKLVKQSKPDLKTIPDFYNIGTDKVLQNKKNQWGQIQQFIKQDKSNKQKSLQFSELEIEEQKQDQNVIIQNQVSLKQKTKKVQQPNIPVFKIINTNLHQNMTYQQLASLLGIKQKSQQPLICLVFPQKQNVIVLKRTKQKNQEPLYMIPIEQIYNQAQICKLLKYISFPQKVPFKQQKSLIPSNQDVFRLCQNYKQIKLAVQIIVNIGQNMIQRLFQNSGKFLIINNMVRIWIFEQGWKCKEYQSWINFIMELKGLAIQQILQKLTGAPVSSYKNSQDREDKIWRLIQKLTKQQQKVQSIQKIFVICQQQGTKRTKFKKEKVYQVVEGRICLTEQGQKRLIKLIDQNDFHWIKYQSLKSQFQKTFVVSTNNQLFHNQLTLQPSSQATKIVTYFIIQTQTQNLCVINFITKLNITIYYEVQKNKYEFNNKLMAKNFKKVFFPGNSIIFIQGLQSNKPHSLFIQSTNTIRLYQGTWLQTTASGYADLKQFFIPMYKQIKVNKVQEKRLIKSSKLKHNLMSLKNEKKQNQK